MVSDQQVKRLFLLMQRENTLTKAALKAGLDEKTARKYLRVNKLPSEIEHTRHWRTRRDEFVDVWEEVIGQLDLNDGLEAKTLFEDLQRRYPGRFQDGQLRTFQRRVKHWRATEGPAQEVFFEQRYRPGDRSQSDFSHMKSLAVTIAGEPFDHLIYHFVLPYSNWETGTICFSESFEALSVGLQNALWELGGVPAKHQTDRLTTAVNKDTNPEVFNRRYMALMDYYGIEPMRIQSACPNENGDVEQRHYRFKRAVEQALLLRGSRDFDSRESYRTFLHELLDRLNRGRKQRLKEELAVLGALPAGRLDSARPLFDVRVTQGSTIRVAGNVYSVNSRLIKERVQVKLYHEHLEVFYGGKCIERLPRLRGKGKARINYRHVIDFLVRKPGAFANYRYREELFPTHRFRMAYDELRRRNPGKADKHYLQILFQAARESEILVDQALRSLFDHEHEITPEAVEQWVHQAAQPVPVRDVVVSPIDLSVYDHLLDAPFLIGGDGSTANVLPEVSHL